MEDCKKTDIENNAKVIVAILAGIAAVIAIGILIAPEKGAETRDSISESLKNLVDSIKDSVAGEIDKLSEFKDKAVESIKSKIIGDNQESNPAVPEQA